MAIYLKFGNVKGNVTADGYAGQIAVSSVNFGVARSVSMEAGNLSNRESSKPSLSEITITKMADNSVAALFKEALTGSAGQEAVRARRARPSAPSSSSRPGVIDPLPLLLLWPQLVMPLTSAPVRLNWNSVP